MSINSSDLNAFFLPQTIKYDKEYLPSLMAILNRYSTKYVAKLKMISPHVLDNVNENISLINNAINYYYNSQLTDAKKAIATIIEKYKDNYFIVNALDELYCFRGVTQNSHHHNIYSEDETCKLSFFKARISDSTFSPFERKDMLHIPFSKRSKTSTQRFSIPGNPCLYFGTSTYVCWEELHRPPLSQFNASSYELPTNLKILNLALDLHIINEMLDSCLSNQLESTEELLELWPLVCATSYNVLEQDRTFKSEYILSQIIMQCVSELHIDGIAYFTKQVEYPRNVNFWLFQWIFVNLAIPATFIADSTEDYCKLCHGIHLTESCNIGEFDLLSSIDKIPAAHAFWHSVCPNQQFIMCNQIMSYKDSIFGKFDDYLVSRKHDVTNFNFPNTSS